MKRIVTIILFAFFTFCSFAQTFEKNFYTNSFGNNTSTRSLTATARNNGVAFTFKNLLNITDSSGAVAHSTSFSLAPGQLLQTSDGGYIVGFDNPQYYSNHSSSPTGLLKTDSTGKILWENALYDTVASHIFKIQEDGAGNIIVLIDSVHNCLLKKYTSAGNLVWSQNVNNGASSFLVTNTGYILSGATPFEILNNTGQTTSIQNTNIPYAGYYKYDIVKLRSGEFCVMNDRNLYNVFDCMLYKLSPTGLLIDSMKIVNIYQSANHDEELNTKISISSDSSLVLFYTLYDSNSNQTTAHLINIQTFGQINWQQSFLGSGNVAALDFTALPNGFVLAGDTGVSINTTNFIIKTDLSGNYNPAVKADSSFSFVNTSMLIDTNNIAAGFNTNGALFSTDTLIPDFFHSHQLNAAFRVPKSGLSNSIFCGNLWISGKSNGDLYNSSQIYDNYMQPGPLGTVPQDVTKWNKIWALTRTEVLAVKNDFETNHHITRPVAQSVMEWPAKGNAAAKGRNGASLSIMEDMAPFIDRNGDGIYNVYDGDYPLMKGDKMLWWIYNDSRFITQNPMRIDERISIYEYASPSDSILNNTLFFSVSVKNQSFRNYDSVRIGTFINFQLGCSENDRMGCLPSKNTFFVYNGPVGANVCDNGSACQSGQIGYGCYSPVQSGTFLTQPMQAFGFFTPGSTYPLSNQAMYYNLSGIYPDGSPYIDSGYGVPGHTTTFLFSGNPDDSSQWSECHPDNFAGLAPGERRCLASIGPFALAAYDTFSFDMAFIFHSADHPSCPDLSASSAFGQSIDSISAYYTSENFPSWFNSTKMLQPAFFNTAIREISSNINFQLLPNPNGGSFSLHLQGSLTQTMPSPSMIC